MNILIAIVAGFSAGVFIRSVYVVGLATEMFLLFVSCVLLIGAYTFHRKIYVVSAIFFLCVAGGIVRTSLVDTPPPEPFFAQVGQRVAYYGVVRDVDVRDAHERITISIEESGVSTRVLAITDRYTLVPVGARVRVYGTLEIPKSFESDGGRTFRYDAYLAKDGIRFLLNYAVLEVNSPAPWYSIMARLSEVKRIFTEGLNTVLPEPYASLAGGITVGGKQGLGTSLVDAFTVVGLVHIVVLSGYNVMVIADAVMAGFTRARFSRRRAAFIGAVTIGLFVLLTGAGTATLRAGLMALIALFARATNRTYAASRALLVVALIMLMWHPMLLVYDPGFVLSLIATAGLIWLSPFIEKSLLWIKGKFVREILATTISAQVAVMPFLLYQTGNLSFVSLIANALVLPVVPIAMALSAIGAIAGIFLAPFSLFSALIIAYPAYLATAYMVLVAEIIAALPFASMTVPVFPFWIVVVAYVLMGWLLVCIYKKRVVNESSTTPNAPLWRQIA